jgi:AraC-like DNA-binding protein
MVRRLFPQALRMPGRFRVFGIGIQESMRTGMVHRPHGGDRCLLMFFYSESCVAIKGGQTELPPNSLMLWTPGMPQSYGHPRKAWNHAWMAFDGTDARRILRHAALAPGQPRSGDSSAVEFYLNGMYREMSDRALPDSRILANLFENWMREINRQASAPAETRPVPQDFRALRRYLHERFDQPMTLDELAERMHVSRWHLCRAFKRHFGQTPMECLQAVRMQHAALFLRDVNLSVQEVARRSGYEDLFHFSKQFKKHYGVSPRAMRKKAWA